MALLTGDDGEIEQAVGDPGGAVEVADASIVDRRTAARGPPAPGVVVIGRGQQVVGADPRRIDPRRVAGRLLEPSEGPDASGRPASQVDPVLGHRRGAAGALARGLDELGVVEHRPDGQQRHSRAEPADEEPSV